MKGYVVNREEVILVEPDTRFFSKLAAKTGTAQDGSILISCLRSCPTVIGRSIYRGRPTWEGVSISGIARSRHCIGKGPVCCRNSPGIIGQQVDGTIADIADQLTAGTCACGTICVREEGIPGLHGNEPESSNS